jgi:hypothetical protein
LQTDLGSSVYKERRDLAAGAVVSGAWAKNEANVEVASLKQSLDKDGTEAACSLYRFVSAFPSLLLSCILWDLLL